MIPTSCQSEPSLIDLLQATAKFLWKDWPSDMEAKLISRQDRRFSMNGTCPHCDKPSVFVQKTPVYYSNALWTTVLECQGCFRCILGIVEEHQYTIEYTAHFPLGVPDDSVSAEVPEHIRLDLSEAKRCLSVNAFNATAEMCRRALEASCIELGASKSGQLQKMIDSLEVKRVITPALRDAAHTVRLGGDRGAHPPEDGPRDKSIVEGPIESINQDQAEDLLSFTEHFFQHVYVIPVQLKNNNYSRKGNKP